MKQLILLPILSILLALPFWDMAEARQFIEPDIVRADQPRSPLDDNLRRGMTFNLMVTNYGFGIGTQYRRVLTPMTEAVVEFQITAVKDDREQAFFSIWGQQIIPNKYQRALSFPLMAGIRHRVLANYIDDNFRIFLQGMAGPSYTFVYPYFRDRIFPNDGLPLGVRISDGDIYDVFQGWGDGSFELGYAGKAALSIDFGSSFRSLTSIEFGFHMLYFPNGLQLMEPNSIVVEDGFIVDRIIGGGFPAEKWYFTPTITLMFGGMW